MAKVPRDFPRLPRADGVRSKQSPGPIDHLITDAEGDVTVESARASERLEDLGHGAPDVVAVIDGIDPADLATQLEVQTHVDRLAAVPVVLMLAIVIFGGLLAASLPVRVALIAIPGTLLVLRLFSEVTEIHVFAPNAATMLGLGLAVDYALLIVNRFREERTAGHDVDAAVERTVATAGVTVVFSGQNVRRGIKL